MTGKSFFVWQPGGSMRRLLWLESGPEAVNSLATATSSITGLERIEFPVSSAEDTNLTLQGWIGNI